MEYVPYVFSLTDFLFSVLCVCGLAKGDLLDIYTDLVLAHLLSQSPTPSSLRSSLLMVIAMRAFSMQ